MSQILTRRPYRREAIDAVQAAWSDGMRRPAVVLATGPGRTVILAKLDSDTGETT